MERLKEKSDFIESLSKYFCEIYKLEDIRVYDGVEPDLGSISFCKDSVKTPFRDFNNLAQKVDTFAKSKKLESELLNTEARGYYLNMKFNNQEYLVDFDVGERAKDSIRVIFSPVAELNFSD